MTGQELKQKLESVGIPKAKLADMIGVFPQSFNKTLKSDNVSSGVLEKLCQVLGKDMSFFYGYKTNEEVTKLQEENAKLKAEVARLSDPNHSEKENRVYNLWMKFMEVTAEMQELYKEKGE